MERKLTKGDYVPDGRGGLTGLTGSDEALQRALFRLTARRGALPLLPDLGSYLYRLPREKPSARQVLALQYAAQALEGEEELTVTGVSLKEEGQGLHITVALDWRGQALSAALTVGEE